MYVLYVVHACSELGRLSQYTTAHPAIITHASIPTRISASPSDRPPADLARARSTATARSKSDIMRKEMLVKMCSMVTTSMQSTHLHQTVDRPLLLIVQDALERRPPKLVDSVD